MSDPSPNDLEDPDQRKTGPSLTLLYSLLALALATAIALALAMVLPFYRSR